MNVTKKIKLISSLHYSMELKKKRRENGFLADYSGSIAKYSNYD